MLTRRRYRLGRLLFIGVMVLGLCGWLGWRQPSWAQMPTPAATPTAVPPQPTVRVPIDVAGHWAEGCLLTLAERRILSVGTDGRVNPDGTVTWNEFTTLLNRAFSPGTAPDWSANPLEQALGLTNQANLASYYPSHYFEPTGRVIRADGLMALAAKLNYSPIAQATATLRATFTDATTIPSYAREGVAAALQQSLVFWGADTRRVEATQGLTRGETAALICQATADPYLRSLLPQERIAVPVTPTNVPLPRSELRGVWLTNIDSEVLFSRQALATAVDRLAALNFNTLYPTVWNWGYTLYPSQVAERVLGYKQGLYPDFAAEGRNEALEATQANRDMLQELVELAHAQQMSVIPWFEFGFMAPEVSALAQRHPDWLTHRADGTPVVMEGRDRRVWLNPFHPEVQTFMLYLADELMANYDVDGFQVDDHFGLPVELGYDPYTVGLYQQDHGGKSPPENPRDPEWVKWRSDKIADFIGDLHRVVKARKPNAVLSVSPNPYPFSYDHYLQDWPTWQQRGFVDELIIQVYRDGLSRFVWEMNKPSAQTARRQIPTSIGVLSGLKRLPVPMSRIQDQVAATRDRSFAGVAFFFYETLWTADTETLEQRQPALRTLFPNRVNRPTRA